MISAHAPAMIAVTLEVILAATSAARAREANVVLPQPATDIAPDAPGLRSATFAGGCFWGVQGVFEHVRGVTRAVAGYSGGSVADPGYAQVSTGRTGHAESVRVTYDPQMISYGALLQIFFSVALDPTQVNVQGPDQGTQYRSALFVDGAEQGRVARAYIAQLESVHAFPRPIATRVAPAGAFYPAEAHHQDYLQRNPDAPYIAYNDMPKVQALHALFPRAWRPVAVTVGNQVSAN